MIYGFFRELARVVEGIIVKQLDLVKSITDGKIFLRVRTISLPLGLIGSSSNTGKMSLAGINK